MSAAISCNTLSHVDFSVRDGMAAHAFEHGPVQEFVVTEEEAEAVRQFLARPGPAAPNLRAAMERAKRFKFNAK